MSRGHSIVASACGLARLYEHRQRAFALSRCTLRTCFGTLAYADWNRNYGATSAPLVVKGKVIVGTAEGIAGIRGLYGVTTHHRQIVPRSGTVPASSPANLRDPEFCQNRRASCR